MYLQDVSLTWLLISENLYDRDGIAVIGNREDNLINFPGTLAYINTYGKQVKLDPYLTPYT